MGLTQQRFRLREFLKMNKNEHSELTIAINGVSKSSNWEELVLTKFGDDESNWNEPALVDFGDDEAKQIANDLVDPIALFTHDALNQAWTVANFNQQVKLISDLKPLQIIHLLTMTRLSALKQKLKLLKNLGATKTGKSDLVLKTIKILGANQNWLLCATKQINDFNNLNQQKLQQICDALAIKNLYLVDARQITQINQWLKTIQYQKDLFRQLTISNNDDYRLKLDCFANS